MVNAKVEFLASIVQSHAAASVLCGTGAQLMGEARFGNIKDPPMLAQPVAKVCVLAIKFITLVEDLDGPKQETRPHHLGDFSRSFAPHPIGVQSRSGQELFQQELLAKQATKRKLIRRRRGEFPFGNQASADGHNSHGKGCV